MISKFAELLTADQVEQVHQGSLEILENVGLLVRNDTARERFVKHGCINDADTSLIKFPRGVVENFLQAIPSKFTFHGRDPSYDRTIPGDGPLVATGSSAPDIIDIQTGQVRRSRSDDIANIAYLINELPGYDIFSISVTAHDAPRGKEILARLLPALNNCLKPIFSSAPSLGELPEVIKLGSIIAGSEAEFWDRPFVTFGYCPVISPLTMDVDSTEKLMRFTELGIPSYGVVAPNAGISAPMTLLGTLTLTNAEFLAQVTLEQMSSPGKPIVYDHLPTVMDIRTGAFSPGAIETGIILMGCTQLARYYNIPSGGFVGLTNSKTNDVQSGFETGMSTMADMLAGADLLRLGGLLDGLMVFDFGKAVIDNEIALMLKQTARGMQFSQENLALDVIAEAGPGGTFMNKAHTVKRMRNTALLPELADRLTRNQWLSEGAPDIRSKAVQKAREILVGDNPAVFSQQVDKSIRAEFKDLVAGIAIT